MPLRAMLVPALLLAAVVAFVAMKPGPTVANPDATATPRPSYTPAASPTATPAPHLPEGVTGRLTYRTGRQLVTVRLPDVVEEQRYVPAETPTDDLSSAYGWWIALAGDDACTVIIHAARNADAASDVIATLDYAACNATAWSDDRRHYAIIAATTDGHTQLVVIGGETPQPRVLIDGTDNIMGFAWHGERLLVSGDFAGRPSLRWLALDGALTPISGLASAPMYLYPSPDSSRFLFTQSSPDGWQLWMLDATTEAVTNLGNMGSDPANASPPNEAGPENTGKGGPMYIAWSPDGTQVAFGGGFDPPYIMTTVQLDTGARATTQFPNGYPGEIRWTYDSKRIAVSTYDVERTHHETWVVDPKTGAGRHIMDGCIIVWSPDGRFLAVHGEDIPGITIINADTAARTQLTHTRDDAPIAWTQ